MEPVQRTRIAAPALRRFVTEVLLALAVPEDEARIVADVLVSADLRGVESHGVQRLHFYVDDLRQRHASPVARLRVLSEWPALAYLDGGASLGHVVSFRAMRKCMDMAEKAGAACVTVTNSRHFGIAGYYAMMALERDMIGLSLTNSRGHAAPTFGRKAMVGTNPIALAAPTGRERPWVLDMATTAIPLGKVEIAARMGKSLRPGLAVDANGQVTTDPAAAYPGGTLLPLGGTAETAGYKGYGLGVLVDILCGVLSGCGYAGIMGSNWGECAIGHFFAAIRVDAVRPVAEFKAMMDEMICALRSSPKAAGQERIILHGEPEWEAQDERLANGIPVAAPVLDELRAIGASVGITGILP
jgi:L-2-hydroxycarboxylate dehydrogenase (NAD+)